MTNRASETQSNLNGTIGRAVAATSGEALLLTTEKLVKEYRGRARRQRRFGQRERGRNRRPARPERRGQNDDVQHGRRRGEAGRRRGHFFRTTKSPTLPMHKRARLGIGYLTQEPSVFRKLTVEENILAILETCKLVQRGARGAVEISAG